MPDYDVIDAHVHTYPSPDIGRQALSGFDASGCCGTPEELTEIMERAGIRLSVQCNMTPARTMLEAGLAALPPEQRETGRTDLIPSANLVLWARSEFSGYAISEMPTMK